MILAAQQMQITFVFLFVFVLINIGPSIGLPAISRFTTRTSFVASVQMLPLTANASSENFNSITISKSFRIMSVVVNNLTFTGLGTNQRTDRNLFDTIIGDSKNINSSPQVVGGLQRGVSSMSISFSSPVSAFGAVFKDFAESEMVLLEFVHTNDNNNSTQAVGPDSVTTARFLGWTSTVPFLSLTFSVGGGDTEGFGMDDAIYAFAILPITTVMTLNTSTTTTTAPTTVVSTTIASTTTTTTTQSISIPSIVHTPAPTEAPTSPSSRSFDSTMLVPTIALSTITPTPTPPHIPPQTSTNGPLIGGIAGAIVGLCLLVVLSMIIRGTRRRAPPQAPHATPMSPQVINNNYTNSIVEAMQSPVSESLSRSGSQRSQYTSFSQHELGRAASSISQSQYVQRTPEFAPSTRQYGVLDPSEV